MTGKRSGQSALQSTGTVGGGWATNPKPARQQPEAVSVVSGKLVFKPRLTPGA
jgi:hypothetical protein